MKKNQEKRKRKVIEFIENMECLEKGNEKHKRKKMGKKKEGKRKRRKDIR